MAVFWQSERHAQHQAMNLVGMPVSGQASFDQEKRRERSFRPDSGRLHRGKAPLKRFITVCGNVLPQPHALFKAHAGELLYHTSRYYTYTEQFLCRLSGDEEFSMAGYCASRLSLPQRQLMAGLLSEEPGRWVAIAIMRVTDMVLAGDAEVPQYLRNVYPIDTPFVASFTHQREGYFWRRVENSGMAAQDPLLNFCCRLNVAVEVDKRDVRLPIGHVYRLLSNQKPSVQRIFSQLVKQLRLQGFRIQNLDRQLEPKYRWR